MRPTSFRAEAKGLVNVVVVGGGAPSVSIIPANSRALVVRLPLEGEGELTSSTVSIATQGEEHCKERAELHQSVWDQRRLNQVRLSGKTRFKHRARV